MSKSINLLLIFVVACGICLFNLPHCLAAAGAIGESKYFSSIIFTLTINFEQIFISQSVYWMGCPLSEQYAIQYVIMQENQMQFAMMD